MSKGRREPFIAAERMRAYRERRRNGLRCMRILLHETEIDSLISKGFLKKERRHDLNAVEDAIGAFICYALGDEGRAAETGEGQRRAKAREMARF